jgi:hypothetical protein
MESSKVRILHDKNFRLYYYLGFLYMSSKNIEKIEPYYMEYKGPKKHVLFIHGLGPHLLLGGIFLLYYPNIFNL